LAKMFGNGRARSGIIVLPCGAGKTLTGVTAAQTIKKSCVCLATNAVSVLQWKYQFQKWTNIPDDRISVFTSDQKEILHPEACVLITTYTMISYSGKRSDQSQQVMDQITGREWGILLMDEV
jgi:DNA excision repair protein ERCC-3